MITKGVRNDYAYVIIALSNAEFDNGMGRGSRNSEQTKSDYVICKQPLRSMDIVIKFCAVCLTIENY